MKIGKISENTLKRSVLKLIKTESDLYVFKGGFSYFSQTKKKKKKG